MNESEDRNPEKPEANMTTEETYQEAMLRVEAISEEWNKGFQNWLKKEEREAKARRKKWMTNRQPDPNKDQKLKAKIYEYYSNGKSKCENCSENILTFLMLKPVNRKEFLDNLDLWINKKMNRMYKLTSTNRQYKFTSFNEKKNHYITNTAFW